MCMSIPGKVIAVNDGIATIDYEGQARQASTLLVNCEVGDWVIVSAKFVMNKVSEEESREVLKVWDETD